MDIGPQYKLDDPFKAAARLQQSKYRAMVLNVDYCEYGNRLTEIDGRALLNYYDGLGVREALRKRYPDYSPRRDADLLRSEHLPFNMLAPLAGRPVLMQLVLIKAFGLKLRQPFQIKIEWAPVPREEYLDDMTSFDAYIQGKGAKNEDVGVGIEVKYTERGYTIGVSEAERVRDRESSYWLTTRESGLFVKERSDELAHDDLRQIWRNHLLGLAMVKQKDISKFVSITMYPEGNQHFMHALKKYRMHLTAAGQETVRSCTFERLIDCLDGGSEIKAWKRYLTERYIVDMPA